jgi:pimeloyl-ACP methyl ester carboxylesterase
MRVCAPTLAAVSTVLAFAATPGAADDARRLLAVDHYVRVSSRVPSTQGQPAQIYVRERVSAGVALRGGAGPDKVVLFVHGAGTPAEVAFDVPVPGYSWMAYLAEAGFDAFSMDTEGYGRSTRPPAMNDPCNLAAAQQGPLVPSLLAAPCPPTTPGQVTTIASDWHAIDAVVEYIRRVRGVQKVSLVAWSLGGPRVGGYAAQHPERVLRMVLLAPAYNREAPAAPPVVLPAAGAVFNTQSRGEFVANWDRQVGCPDQYDPAVRDAVWADMLASDPVGATWGTGLRRAPSTTTWGWTPAVLAGTTIPTLFVAGVHDKQVPPARVRAAYEAFGAAEKVFVDLGCASHNAMWERPRTLLFDASRQWLATGAIGERTSGEVRLGY